MTSKLWGSRIRRETTGPGKVHIVERYATRPWPADPAEYPLNSDPRFLPAGDGRTYVVSKQPDPVPPAWLAPVAWFLMGVVWAAAGLAGLALGSCVFDSLL